MKKVKKFGAGDLVTGIGAVLLGKALYDKYKGKDDDEKEPEAVGGASRRPKTIEEQIGRKAEPKDEKRREISDYMINKPKKTEGGETRPGPGASESAGRKDNVVVPSKPAAQDVKVKPASQTFPRDDDALNRRRLEGLSTPKRPSASSGTKGTQDLGKILGVSSDAKGTQTLGERIKGTVDSAGKSVARTPAERMAENARLVEERRRREAEGMKKGGKVKKYASGGSVSSASKRADGIAQRGKTKGRIC